MADDDQLYALPLEEFTPARDAAAKELRKAGDRETAARVAKLPKPTPAAWAANQVAREQPELIEALLDAGAALRAAQDAARRRRRRRGLREATQAERGAVDAVMRAPRRSSPAGKPLSRAMADRLRTTLHAAAGDEAMRAALSAGRLVGEAQAGGAWPFALEPSRRRCPRSRAPKKKPAAKQKPRREADERRRPPSARPRNAPTGETRKALEDELREARGTLRVRERVANGRRGGRAGGGRGASTRAQAALDQAAQGAWRTRRPRPSPPQRVLDEARARSATRPATPSRGSRNGWIDGAPALGSSRRWLN